MWVGWSVGTFNEIIHMSTRSVINLSGDGDRGGGGGDSGGGGGGSGGGNLFVPVINNEHNFCGNPTVERYLNVFIKILFSNFDYIF